MKSDFIYLNNSATSWPKPPCVAEAVSKALTGRPGSAQRAGIEDFDVFGAVRGKMAAILGVKQQNHIVLCSNATMGLNIALFGFPFKEGDTVVTSVSEHNSVLRPLYELSRRGLIKVIYVATDDTGRIPPDKWKAAITENKPRLVVFNHASNVTGAVNDAAVLTGIAGEAGAFVLADASQTCGWQDIKAEEWGIDMVAFTGHKYLLGPQGTGGLYVSPKLNLNPFIIGGTGSYSDLPTMPEEMPKRLEAGTGNEPSFHGLLAALDWAEQNPLDRAAQDDMLIALRRGLVDAGAEVIVPDGACIPTVSFNVPGYTPAETGFILGESYDIICRTGLHCAPGIFSSIGRRDGTVRFSTSRFTTMDEIGEAIDAVKDICDAV